jgi:CO/xanthine dehydrogenase FAD-binding subunit
VDLNTVAEVVSPASVGQWRPGDAWLGGGTALFASPSPHIRRLLDLTTAGWEPLTSRPDGLEIAATCTVATLAAHEHHLIDKCCHAFLASFKIWNVATVGGNLCAALPAGPMIALGAALDGVCRLLGPSGSREVPVSDFATGDGRNALRDGELLRSVFLPREFMVAPTAFRQASLHAYGRSAALLIGRRDAGGGFVLTVTASTTRPFVLRFGALPSPEMLQVALAERIPERAYVRDVHGLPAWRRHLTRMYAEEIRAELEFAG